MVRILLIDDDRDLAHLTKMALVKSGYDVLTFYEAKTAGEEARRQKPDLILMDVMLPGMDGAEAVRELRKDNNLRNIPVLFLSALVSSREKNSIDAAINVDGTQYKILGKPFEIEELLESIRNMSSSIVRSGE